MRAAAPAQRANVVPQASYSTRSLTMWGGVGNPKIRPRPIAPIRHPVTRRMLNVKEWLSSMKSSKPDPSIPQYMTPGGPEPMFVMRLPDGPELKVSPENIRPGFKWLAKKHPKRKKLESVYFQVHTKSKFAPMVMEALNLAEHEMREEKIQSDEILAREKIIQANLEKALGGSGTRALIKAQMEKERREVAAADAGSVVGKLAKNKAAAKRIAKVEKKEARKGREA